MKKQRTEEEKLLKEIQDDLTREIESIKKEALKRATALLGREINIQSLNGMVGGKNNVYVDSVRMQFLDFDDFFSKWLKGLNDTFTSEKKTFLRYNSVFDWTARGSFRGVLVLKDPIIFRYTELFLERNFYKHINQRMRLKPDETLWAIWFGYKLVYGLLIAPEINANSWRIDKSEIRKVKYNYWTVGHVMQTGLIDPELNEAIKFNDLESFYQFYLSVLNRLSSSQYEKEISKKYIQYLRSSREVLEEPFLIPEFRYLGLEHKHEYRLDFTILNQHTMDFIGFEISPASSHMQVSNLKQKQIQVNDELKDKWEKEMAKRNKYFDSFGITIKTFTDKALEDIDSCFEEIKSVLEKRPSEKTSVKSQKDRLENL
jgi:hypothetical protein